MRFLLTVFFSTFLLTLTPLGAANAQFLLCNKTSYTLSAAIGYVEVERLGTRGWWRLRPGQCKIVLTEKINPGRYFVFAEGIPGHKGDQPTWSGDYPLCVENSGFFNIRNQEICDGDPTISREFLAVEVTPSAGGTWQSDFAEQSNFSIYSAEVAGVQRLLRDIGRNIRRIDGSLGRETRSVLTAYRKSKGLSEDATIDGEVIDMLIDEANAIDAKLGFFYCNKTDADVWSAIGLPGANSNYFSKGWWKLKPGECTKVVKGELKHDHYYVYALVEEPDGTERRLAGGDKTLCVNPVKFDVSDETSCVDQGLEEAIFKRIEIGGAQSATYDFQAGMFVAPPVN